MMSWRQRRGKYASQAPRAGPPEALDEPFGPPPEEYLYRCPVCGEEMLVNEAIIDVAIGAAKFRGNRPWDAHHWVPRMQRRDDGVRRARALGRP